MLKTPNHFIYLFIYLFFHKGLFCFVGLCKIFINLNPSYPSSLLQERWHRKSQPNEFSLYFLGWFVVVYSPVLCGLMADQKRIVEKLWQEFFADPSQWWDHRPEKVPN